MKRFLLATAAVAALMLLAGCDEPSVSSTEMEKHATEAQAKQAAVTVGVPAIINFAEKRQLKMIYELRDQADLVTYTYTIDMQGRRHTVCPKTSVGFGVPYATQFTNPMRAIWGNQSAVTVPQADPNALFSPASADGTWVLCLDPAKGTLAPAYVEPHVVVYLFEMPHID